MNLNIRKIIHGFEISRICNPNFPLKQSNPYPIYFSIGEEFEFCAIDSILSLSELINIISRGFKGCSKIIPSDKIILDISEDIYYFINQYKNTTISSYQKDGWIISEELL